MNIMKPLTALCLFLLFCMPALETKSAPPPNIVFFLVDDLGWRDTSCYGSALYETPAIDQLAESGMKFNQAYAAHPRCVPSRYALMTGRFPARAGIPARSHNMKSSERTMAEALRDHGYATFFAGKWHLMKKPDEAPEQQGFDINIGGGKPGAPGSHFAPYNKSRDPYHKTEGDIPGLDDAPDGEYLADRLTDETIRFIEKHHSEKPEQPFFVYLSHYAVHTPIEGKADKTERYREKVAGMEFSGAEYIDKDGNTKMRQDNPDYAAMVESTDESLARIIATLETLGIRERTAIILTSDHGGLSNRGLDNKRQLATSNLPLRAGKGHCYEGGIRVPLIVDWPGVTSPGSESDFLTTGTDHFPTLLDIAGLPSEPNHHLDGVSYAAALRGEETARSQPVFWYSPRARPKSTGDQNCSVVRSGPFKLINYFDENIFELYNLDNDPEESNNLAESDPEKLAELQDILHQWTSDIQP